MVNFVLIIICLGAGMVLSRLRVIPRQSYKSINAWVLYVAIPALSLRFVPEIEWSSRMLVSALAPVLIWVGAWAFAAFYAKKKCLDPATKTALVVTCGLGNTSFLGFPMISAYFGEGQIRNALLFDQMTFLIFSTLAVILVMRTSAGKENNFSIKLILKKIFSFPPFLGCLTALILPNFVDISPANPLFDKLAATVSPMALFSIGLQLRFGEFRRMAGLVSAALSYKLLLAPALVLGLVLALSLVMGNQGDIGRITVFEAAMPSHITASLLLSQHNLNRKFCTLVVGVGIVASFASSTLWWWILKYAI